MSIEGRTEFRNRARWAWKVVLRGKFLILACVLLVMAPALLYLQQATPRYTAAADILIDAPDTSDTLLERSASPRARLTDSVVQTEAEVLSSTSLARRVVDKLGLDRDPEFNPALRAPGLVQRIVAMLNPSAWLPLGPSGPVSVQAREQMAKARVIGQVASRLVVRTQRRSFVIEIQFTAEDREKAALITNTFADLYVLERLETTFEETKRVTSWLSERLDALRQDVATAEAAAESYRAANGLRRAGERQATVNDQQLTELNSRLVLARADLAQKSARLEQVRALTRSSGGFETSNDVLQSSLIQRLREQEASLQRQISEAAKTLGDRHPQMIGYRADLAELRGKIGQEVGKIAASLSGEVDVASVGVRTIERELDRLRGQSDTAGGAGIRLRELERDAETSRGLYEAFLARFKRDASQEQIQRANARVLSRADIPPGASYPRKQVVVMLALAFALAAGTGLVFLIDRLDSGIRSADEAEELAGLPTLAMIPLARRRRGAALEQEVVRHPRSALADAVRSLRTAIVLGEREGESKVLLVTSSVPKEGKSFVSLCLASLFAKAQPRVLLIDADVHRPRLHTALGIAGETGLCQVLAGQAELEQVVVADPGSGLFLLPAGSAGPHQDEIINGPGMEALVRRLAQDYDRIIIDSPPILAIADTRMLSRVADQVVYVVRWNATSREAVRAGLKLLRESGARLAGTVLSQVNMRKHARYGYGDYGQYYGRYRDYYAD